MDLELILNLAIQRKHATDELTKKRAQYVSEPNVENHAKFEAARQQYQSYYSQLYTHLNCIEYFALLKESDGATLVLSDDETHTLSIYRSRNGMPTITVTTKTEEN